MKSMKAIAYIDESGQKGLIRNLTPERNDAIGLLCALVFPAHRLDQFRVAFAPPFERFKAEGGTQLKKPHITEAFKPGNENLRPMATEVRNTLFELVQSKQVPIIYCARRMRLLREHHDRLEELKARARSARRATHLAVPERPSADRVEQDLMTGLALRLDAFAQDANIEKIDLATDDMDLPILVGLREAVDSTKSITSIQDAVKAYDLNAQKPVQGSIAISIPNPPFELDVKHIGTLDIVGKVDPFVFVTDAVGNALSDHLSSLPPDRPLNAPSSVAGWALERRVWGVMDDALEDIL